MKQKMSKWELLFVVGLMLVLAVGLWGTSGSGMVIGAQALSAGAPQVTNGGGDEPGTIAPTGAGAGRVMPAIDGAGASGQVAFWSDADSLTGDSALYWDNGNKRLGVGTTSPARPLHLVGNVCQFERTDADSAGFIIKRTAANRWVLGVNDLEASGQGFVISTYPEGAPMSTPRLLVTQDGNVGIGTGTTSPTRKLDVLATGGTGVYGETGSGYSHGVHGKHTGSGDGSGVYGETTSSGAGAGVYGKYGTSGPYGYLGDSGYGAYGADPGGNYGYLGSSEYGAYGSGSSSGVQGVTSSGYGVKGETTNSSGTAVFGQNSSGRQGYLGSSNYGAFGQYSAGLQGYLGGANYGVFGQYTGGGNQGYLGSANYGAYGANSNGNYGYLGDSATGVFGQYNNGPQGYLASSNYGAYGMHPTGANWGALGTANAGVEGQDNGGTIIGRLATPNEAVFGQFPAAGGGVIQGKLGTPNEGVYGQCLPQAPGIGPPWAGNFNGNVNITGSLSVAGPIIKPMGGFRIDHPLDPEHKYLQHSFVESPDMMNVYNGNIVLDDDGEAVVELPSYFEALNRDFRYQLTAIGAPGPNLYIAQKIAGNQFKIAGGSAGLEVSWQVTGIRHDAAADANRIQVEMEKPGN